GLAASASPTTVVTPPPGRAAVTATPPLSVTRPPGRGLDTATPAVALTRPPGIAIVTTTPAVTVTRPPGRPGATPGATTGPTLSFEPAAVCPGPKGTPGGATTSSTKFDWEMKGASAINPSAWPLRLFVTNPARDSSYSWCLVRDGQLLLEDGADVVMPIPELGLYEAVLTATGADGSITVASGSIEVRDYLVVSIGDSLASGEGNPDVPGVVNELPVWSDTPCHRSR